MNTNANAPQVEQLQGGGHVFWTDSMSSYMLSHLAGLVGTGLRTCDRALNDHFRMRLTEDQIVNHVRTWKRKYAKICAFKRLSAALWEEETCTITLDHEHYRRYIKVLIQFFVEIFIPLSHYSC
jgi:hypothetical protein